MELRHLRYFVAVAEELNFSRAAERLHVSQPPLSRQIRDLEEELNVTLLERTRQSVRLTGAGRIALVHARKLLRDAELLRQEVLAAATEDQEELHIGYAPSPTAEILSAILFRFQELAPGARVTFHDLNHTKMIAGIRSRSLHAALTLWQLPGELRGLKFETIRRYSVGIICAESSPWYDRKSISPRTLAGVPLVGYDKGDFPEYYRWVAKIIGVPTGRIKVRQQCDGVVSLIAAVESGRGPAVVGEFIAAVAGKRVKFIPFSSGPARLKVGLLYPSNGLSARASKFLEACQSSFGTASNAI